MLLDCDCKNSKIVEKALDVRLFLFLCKVKLKTTLSNRADDKTNNKLLVFATLAVVDFQVGVGNCGGAPHVICDLFLFMCYVGGFPYCFGHTRV